VCRSPHPQEKSAVPELKLTGALVDLANLMPATLKTSCAGWSGAIALDSVWECFPLSGSERLLNLAMLGKRHRKVFVTIWLVCGPLSNALVLTMQQFSDQLWAFLVALHDPALPDCRILAPTFGTAEILMTIWHQGCVVTQMCVRSTEELILTLQLPGVLLVWQCHRTLRFGRVARHPSQQPHPSGKSSFSPLGLSWVCVHLANPAPLSLIAACGASFVPLVQETLHTDRGLECSPLSGFEHRQNLATLQLNSAKASEMLCLVCGSLSLALGHQDCEMLATTLGSIDSDDDLEPALRCRLILCPDPASFFLFDCEFVAAREIAWDVVCTLVSQDLRVLRGLSASTTSTTEADLEAS